MMISKQVNNFSTTKPLTIFPNYAGLSTGSVSNVQFPVRHGHNFHRKKSTGRMRAASKTIKAQVTAVPETATAIKGAVTVKVTVKDTITDIITISRDDITDMLGKTLLIELVSTDLDPNTGEDKATIKAYAHKVAQDKFNAKYEVKFVIPPGFGNVGAILVENEHRTEMFLDDVVLSGFKDGPVHISCKSWIHSKFDDKKKRVFFTNKSYLPSETPEGLRRLREDDLEILRGDGQGERKKFERVYDYDNYNDLGNPDKPDLVRPVIGTKELPYPRRCRTGRPRTKKDPLSETRSNSVYVPRDESFSEIKQVEFQAKTLKSVLHALVPTLENTFQDPDLGFPYFTAIDTLFNEGVNVPTHKNQGKFQPILPRIIKAVKNQKEDVLLFETPEMIDRDKFSWFRDEEFSRQVLAGLNPYSIELVREWPLKSKLDPNIYGPAESKITKEIIEQEIRGFMTVEEALKQKKLYMLDYHDLYLPYVDKVRALKNTTLYGSRTIFFLTHEGTLRPVAIELTRPKSPNNPVQWKEVFTPKWDATSCWLWRMAKAHVCAHDSGFHQLVVHWLRTHACTEPYIIAANRQLSTMHPIYRLLHPHFRYTMEINALAREQLISGGGVIEGAFFPGKYAIELSAVAYGALWRFDQENLPADLIKRGMAVEDPTAKHGLKLAIEDYPFANDGLILWDNIKQWVTDYVSHYYPNEKIVKTDTELQNWWTEVRTKGHADKKDEPWWPVLNTPADLIQVLTTIIWVTAGHHAAVNFGQYMFAGYFPNRPTITRTNMPTEDPTDEALKRFLKRPESVLLESFPSQIQATKVMAVLDVLSSHSPDEEYLGKDPEPYWAEDPVIMAAFERFSGKLKELEGIIDERNTDLNLKNRTGAGVVPYELLKPYSEAGVTGMGVPNSISI